MDDTTDIQQLLAHAGWARTLARRLAGETDADDLVQDLWLCTLRSPPPSDRDTRGWVSTVVRNLARLRHREQSRRGTRERIAARPEAQPGAGEVVARASVERQIIDAVWSLPQAQRDVVLLRYYENLPPRDVAKRLDVPVETVRTRLRRGRDRLRTILDERAGSREAWAGSVVGATTLALATKTKVAIAITIAVGIAAVAWTFTSPSLTPPTPGAAGPTIPVAPDERHADETAAPALPSATTRRDRAADAPIVAPTEVATTGDVRGRITLDDDGATPFDGADVFVLRKRTGQWKATKTAGRGTYRIAGLAPGTWRMMVRPAGYPDLTLEFAVHAGLTTTQDVMIPRGIIAAGRCVDSRTGEGIAGAKIQFNGKRRHTGTTDRDGTFRVVGLDADMVASIRADADGYDPAFARRTLDPNVRDLRIDLSLHAMPTVCGVVLAPDGTAVAGARVAIEFRELAAGGAFSATADDQGRFRLRLSTGLTNRKIYAGHAGFAFGVVGPYRLGPGETKEGVTIRLREAGIVEGVVTDPNGTTSVFVYSRDYAMKAPWERRPMHKTKIDDSSGFCLDTVPPGDWLCRAVGGPADDMRLSPAVPITVTAGRRTNAITLTLGATRGVIAGRVIDDRGEPLAGAKITLHCATAAASPTGQRADAESDTDGRFRFERLVDGEFRAWVTMPGHTPSEVALRPGTGDATLRLARRPVITGRVVDGTGRPVPRFRVRVILERDGKRKAVDDRRTFERGTFRAPLAVLQPDLWTTPGRLRVEAYTEDGALSQSEALDFTPGEPLPAVLLRLTAGATITGHIRSKDGRPIPSASVEVQCDANGVRAWVRTTTSGRFRVASLPPGRYDIRAAHRDWPMHRSTIDIAAGTSRTHDIVLNETGARLTFIVQKPDGTPLVGARVFCRAGTRNLDRDVYEWYRRSEPGLTWKTWLDRQNHTDANGRWSRGALGPSTYESRVTAPGFRDRAVKVDVPADRHVTTTVTLQPK